MLKYIKYAIAEDKTNKNNVIFIITCLVRIHSKTYCDWFDLHIPVFCGISTAKASDGGQLTNCVP